MTIDFIHGPGRRDHQLAPTFADEEIDPWDLREDDRDPVDEPGRDAGPDPPSPAPSL